MILIVLSVCPGEYIVLKSWNNPILCYANGFVLMRAFRITKNHHLRSKIEEIMALCVRRLLAWWHTPYLLKARESVLRFYQRKLRFFSRFICAEIATGLCAFSTNITEISCDVQRVEKNHLVRKSPKSPCIIPQKTFLTGSSRSYRFPNRKLSTCLCPIMSRAIWDTGPM